MKKILKYCIIFYPLMDIIYTITNKFLNVNLPINQGIRVMIMCFLFTKIKSKKSILKILCLITILVIAEFMHVYMDIGYINIADNISFIIKIINMFIMTYFFEELLQEEYVSKDELIKYIALSSLIISISILISPLGLGLKSWENDVRWGYKGLFTVQNTITATLLMIIPFSYYYYYKTKDKKYALILLLNIISTIMIGTKAGIVGIASILIIFIFIYMFTSKTTYFKLFALDSLILLIPILIIMLKDSMNRFISQQMEIYASGGYSDLSSFLISNRNLQMMYINDYLSNSANKTLSMIWGLGYSSANFIISSRKIEFQAIEMDFYGLYYYFGILILICVAYFILKRIFSGIKKVIKDKTVFNFIIFLSAMIALIHSFFGGHVIYEALSTLYFSIILAFCNVTKSTTNDIK